MSATTRIYLKIIDGWWHGDHRDAGAPAGEIVDLFGTSIIPTAMGASVSPYEAYTTIQALNPMVAVMVASPAPVGPWSSTRD